MDSNSTVDLIVESDLPVRFVFPPGKLDAIHAEVGIFPSGPGDVFGIDLGEGDEGAAVHRPGNDLRKSADRRCALSDGTLGDEPGEHLQGGKGGGTVSPRIFHKQRRIDFEFDHPADSVDRVPKEKASSVEGSEKITECGKGASGEPLEVNGRPPRLINPAEDGGSFEGGIDLG